MESEGFRVGVNVTIRLPTFTVVLCPLGGKTASTTPRTSGTATLILAVRTRWLYSRALKPGVVKVATAFVLKTATVETQSYPEPNPPSRHVEMGTTTLPITTKLAASYRMAVASTLKVPTKAGKVAVRTARPKIA